MSQPAARSGDPASTELARLVAAHHDAAAFYRQHLAHADGPRRYLANRGLGRLLPSRRPQPAGTDDPWQLGYAPPGWTNLVEHLTAAGYTPAELAAAGLAAHNRTGRTVDLFRDRITFPIHSPTGQVVGFVARAAPGAGMDVPKYLNSPDTVSYHKGQTLYGVGEQAERIAAGAAPVVVEGPIDVLAVWLAYPDADRFAVAACGTGLTAHHAGTVAAMPGAARHGVTTALDNDDAGRKATPRAWQLLSAHPGLALFAAFLPNGTDPADLITTDAGIAVLRAALTEQAHPLAQAVIDLRLDHLTQRHPDLMRWIESRVGAARDLARLLIDLRTGQIVALTGYIAHRTGLGYDTVADAVIDHLERAPPRRPPDANVVALNLRTRPRTFPPPESRRAEPPLPLHAVKDDHPPRRTR